jgi:hypothetical protein
MVNTKVVRFVPLLMVNSIYFDVILRILVQRKPESHPPTLMALKAIVLTVGGQIKDNLHRLISPNRDYAIQ